MHLTPKAQAKLHERTTEILKSVLVAKRPKPFDYETNDLAEEIARRVVENAKLVERRRLRDQVLIVLADYRNHQWTGGALKGEGTRIVIADQIMSVRVCAEGCCLSGVRHANEV